MYEPIERGEPDEFEVVWKSGHVDRVKAHQVTWPNNSAGIGAMFGGPQPGPSRVMFHAEIDGAWRLMLSALEDEIASIRNVSQITDLLLGGES